jgi:hypothetical protein
MKVHLDRCSFLKHLKCCSPHLEVLPIDSQPKLKANFRDLFGFPQRRAMKLAGARMQDREPNINGAAPV